MHCGCEYEANQPLRIRPKRFMKINTPDRAIASAFFTVCERIALIL